MEWSGVGVRLDIHCTDASPHSYSHPDTYAFPDTNADAGTYGHANSHCYGHSDTDTTPNANTDAGTYEHIDAYRVPYEHAVPYKHADSYEHARAAYSHPNSYALAQRGVDGVSLCAECGRVD